MKPKFLTSYNKYGNYCVPLLSCHRPAAQKILSHHIHEPETIEFILSNCGNGDIIHAGTYFGDFLPAFAKGITSHAKIWAFEPNIENYFCAKFTLTLNDIENTILINAGLGDKKEVLLIKTVDKNGRSLGGASRIIDKKLNKNNSNGTQSIQMVTIDEIVDSTRKISIIQLDIQGYEIKALKGALKTIRKNHPILILEVTPNNTLINNEWFLNNILNFGYNKIGKVHNNIIFSYKKFH